MKSIDREGQGKKHNWYIINIKNITNKLIKNKK